MFRLLLILLPMCLVFAACQRTGQRTDAPVQSSTLAWLLADDGTRMTTEEFLQNPKVSRVHGIDPVKGLCQWDKVNDVAIMDLEFIPTGLDTLVPIQLLSHEAVDLWIRKGYYTGVYWRLSRILETSEGQFQLEVQRSDFGSPVILSWNPPIKLPRSDTRDDRKIDQLLGRAVDAYSRDEPARCRFYFCRFQVFPIIWSPILAGPSAVFLLSGTNGEQILHHLLRDTRRHVGFRDGQAFVGTAESLLRAGFVPPQKEKHASNEAVELAACLQQTSDLSATCSAYWVDILHYFRVRNQGFSYAWVPESYSSKPIEPRTKDSRLSSILSESLPLDGLDWMSRSGKVFIGSKNSLATVSAPRRMIHPLDDLSPARKNTLERQIIERRFQTKMDFCSGYDIPLEDALTVISTFSDIPFRIDASVSATTPIGDFIFRDNSITVCLSTILCLTKLTKLRYALEENGILIGTEESLRNQGYDEPPDLWDPHSVDLPWMARFRERLRNKVSFQFDSKNYDHPLETVWFQATGVPLVIDQSARPHANDCRFEKMTAYDILHHLAVQTHTAPILKDGAILLASPERIEIERRPRVWKAVASKPSQIWAQNLAKFLEKSLPEDPLSEEEMTALEKHTGFHWQIDPDDRMIFYMSYGNLDRIPTNYREIIEATCFASDLDYCIEPGKIHIGHRDTIAATGLRLQK